MAHLIEVKNVYKIYNPGENEVRALDAARDPGKGRAAAKPLEPQCATWLSSANPAPANPPC